VEGAVADAEALERVEAHLAECRIRMDRVEIIGVQEDEFAPDGPRSGAALASSEPDGMRVLPEVGVAEVDDERAGHNPPPWGTSRP